MQRKSRRSHHPFRDVILKALDLELATNFEEYGSDCRIDAVSASEEAAEATIESLGHIKSLGLGEAEKEEVFAAFMGGVTRQTEVFSDILRRPVHSREERETRLADPFVGFKKSEPNTPHALPRPTPRALPRPSTKALPRPSTKALPNQTTSSQDTNPPSMGPNSSPPRKKGRPKGSKNKKVSKTQDSERDGQPLEPLQDILDGLTEDS